ncbi:hypothetical protein BDB00DRAFT_830065 [Zychaea mexicana]|uniref:uncharacterized protein n=1 Tax=Zychaea mexicana TaxID=64656 RepID=UPI0022FDBD46|nr:uncharacterized protein BDB00DRAFT_830065 [Zychaea mexicana]KAI9492070.1 hypothetical protein BDB00DRAFT_830065 [Zychaea mexicana]
MLFVVAIIQIAPPPRSNGCCASCAREDLQGKDHSKVNHTACRKRKKSKRSYGVMIKKKTGLWSG